MEELFTKDDVIPNSYGENFEGKWLILDLKTSLENGWIKPEYVNKKNQLYLANSGFGCDPHKMGRKIFGVFAVDFDDNYITCRPEVLGIAKPETIEAWKSLYPELAGNIEKCEKGEYERHFG